MNCKDFENMIHEVATQRVADRAKQLEALEHAGHCLWCAVRFDDELKLTESLRGFAETLGGRGAPPRVERELIQAFRERAMRTSSPSLGLVRKRLWQGLGWGLAFAATLAAVWVMIFERPRLRPLPGGSSAQVVHKQPIAAAQVPQPSATPVPVAEPARPALKSALGHDAPHRSPKRATLDEPQSELTTDFIPLGTCDDSQCMEDATLVRVSLPAEALLAFGVATDNDFATEGSVQADVALGSDGLPFAIRFVE